MSELISEYQVPKAVIYRWRDQAIAGLPGLFCDQQERERQAKEQAWKQEREELYAEIGK